MADCESIDSLEEDFTSTLREEPLPGARTPDSSSMVPVPPPSDDDVTISTKATREYLKDDDDSIGTLEIEPDPEPEDDGAPARAERAEPEPSAAGDAGPREEGRIGLARLRSLEQELDALDFSVAALEAAADGDGDAAEAMATCGRVADVVDAFVTAHRESLDGLGAARAAVDDETRAAEAALAAHVAATVDAIKLRLRAAYAKLKRKHAPEKSGFRRAYETLVGTAAGHPPTSPKPPTSPPPLDTLTPPKSDVRSP